MEQRFHQQTSTGEQLVQERRRTAAGHSQEMPQTGNASTDHRQLHFKRVQCTVPIGIVTVSSCYYKFHFIFIPALRSL